MAMPHDAFAESSVLCYGLVTYTELAVLHILLSLILLLPPSLLLPVSLMQLALVLLSEVKQGRASKFSDYLALLPDQVDVPALWNEEELQQLRCPYFIEQV
jgi:hypothetical protein